MYQIAWEDKFDIFGEIAERYAKYAQGIGKFDKSRDVNIVFDGYFTTLLKIMNMTVEMDKGIQSLKLQETKK